MSASSEKIGFTPNNCSILERYPVPELLEKGRGLEEIHYALLPHFTSMEYRALASGIELERVCTVQSMDQIDRMKRGEDAPYSRGKFDVLLLAMRNNKVTIKEALSLGGNMGDAIALSCGATLEQAQQLNNEQRDDFCKGVPFEQIIGASKDIRPNIAEHQNFQKNDKPEEQHQEKEEEDNTPEHQETKKADGFSLFLKNFVPQYILSYFQSPTAIKEERVKELPTIQVDPEFIKQSPVELQYVKEVSRFNSLAGHPYGNPIGDLKCHSQKHYFVFTEGIIEKGVLPQIYTPFNCIVTSIRDDSPIDYSSSLQDVRGKQIHLQAKENPNFYMILFHVTASSQLHEGAHLSAGDVIGTHYSFETNSDIALYQTHEDGQKYLPAFKYMSDELLSQFGLSKDSLDKVIISPELRQAFPCNNMGSDFVAEITTKVGEMPPEDWYVLPH
jgi:hypothetical protein